VTTCLVNGVPIAITGAPSGRRPYLRAANHQTNKRFLTGTAVVNALHVTVRGVAMWSSRPPLRHCLVAALPRHTRKNHEQKNKNNCTMFDDRIADGALL